MTEQSGQPKEFLMKFLTKLYKNISFELGYKKDGLILQLSNRWTTGIAVQYCHIYPAETDNYRIQFINLPVSIQYKVIKWETFNFSVGILTGFGSALYQDYLLANNIPVFAMPEQLFRGDLEYQNSVIDIHTNARGHELIARQMQRDLAPWLTD